VPVTTFTILYIAYLFKPGAIANSDELNWFFDFFVYYIMSNKISGYLK